MYMLPTELRVLVDNVTCDYVYVGIELNNKTICKPSHELEGLHMQKSLSNSM